MSQTDEAITEFESMRNLAELQALSKHSLETPLTPAQYDRMMELQRLVLGVV